MLYGQENRKDRLDNNRGVITTKEKTMNSPFQKAKTIAKRLKLLVYGDSGVGKTTLALAFPSPVVIDTEGGTELYGDHFDFDVIRTNSAEQIMTSVDWLLTNQHSYRTLIVDTISVYWDALQRKWSDSLLNVAQQRGGRAGGYKKAGQHEFYDMQMKDWKAVKNENKELVRKLIALPLNVVVIAREKPHYEDGVNMKRAGETYDGEKNLAYEFDTVVRLYRNGGFKGIVLKDRTNRLPANFDCSFAVFDEKFSDVLYKDGAPKKPTADPKLVQQLSDLATQLEVSDKEKSGMWKYYKGDYAAIIETLQKQKASLFDRLNKVCADCLQEEPEGPKFTKELEEKKVDWPGMDKAKKSDVERVIAAIDWRNTFRNQDQVPDLADMSFPLYYLPDRILPPNLRNQNARITGEELALSTHAGQSLIWLKEGKDSRPTRQWCGYKSENGDSDVQEYMQALRGLYPQPKKEETEKAEAKEEKPELEKKRKVGRPRKEKEKD